MMQISRRDALLGATAAAVVTGAATVPLATKAAGVKSALGGDPVLPAYEAFEAARRAYLAADNHMDVVWAAVDVEMPPEPYAGHDLTFNGPEWNEAVAWREEHCRRMTDRLGAHPDNFLNSHSDRIWNGYHDLMDIRATTVAGLLCQVRAWWAARVDQPLHLEGVDGELQRFEEGAQE